MTSNRLASAMASQSRIKGITCSCCFLWYIYVIFKKNFFLSVISYSDIQRAIKLLIAGIELEFMYSLVPLAILYLLHIAMLF